MLLQDDDSPSSNNQGNMSKGKGDIKLENEDIKEEEENDGRSSGKGMSMGKIKEEPMDESQIKGKFTDYICWRPNQRQTHIYLFYGFYSPVRFLVFVYCDSNSCALITDEVKVKEEPQSPKANDSVDTKPTIVPEPIPGSVGQDKKKKCRKSPDSCALLE